ncbi:MAG TPA: PAS domain S-box protein [Burkholderiales bacterium]|nr:PAS domain S-box protein [Burkholderiales bacterium]
MSDLIDPKLYRLVVEQTKDYALFVLDPTGRIMTWGAGGQRLKGYDPDEIIGRHFSVFYTREAIDRGWPAHELKMAALEGRFEDEGWRVRKDGSQFWASVTITALRDENGKLVGYSKITRDHSDRRLTEEALRQSEERFRLLVDGVSDYAIYMLAPDGVVTSWNTGAQRIKGYTSAEIIGKHFSRFYAAPDIEAGKPWEALARARSAGRAEDEGWRIKKNGERFWARTAITPLHDSAGHMRGFAKVTQDLTERRYVQDLEQTSRNVSTFISLLTHELRNPLAPIRTAIQVMTGMPEAASPALQTMLQMVDRQSTHLARILDDMMEASRAAQGKITIEQKVVDMTEVIQRALEAATPSVEAANHHVTLDLPTKGLLAHGDSNRLTQLLTNLLNNAARYTPQGGQITIKARAEEGSAIIQVADSGRGIAPDDIERIFAMFVQAGSSENNAGGGLGVGLALARTIAELHGGSLTARSEGVNTGSEFTLKLPLGVGLVEKPGVAAPQPAVRGVPHRILVVDDNVDAAASLEILLKSLGHETCVVHDGISAIEMTEQFRPDIVLLDLGMPGLDGYETARRLRALKKDQSFRIIAVTGWGQDSDRQKTREAGFDLHLTKPVEVEDLMQAVSSGGTTRTIH